MPQVSPEHSETDQERLEGEVKHTNVIMVFPHSCSEKGGIVMPVSHMMKGRYKNAVKLLESTHLEDGRTRIGLLIPKWHKFDAGVPSAKP